MSDGGKGSARRPGQGYADGWDRIFKKHEMTAEQFTTAQENLRLSNKDIESMFQVSDQTVINWRKGNTRVPAAVAIVMGDLSAKTKS